MISGFPRGNGIGPEANYVTLTGTQTVSGVKTFSGNDIFTGNDRWSGGTIIVARRVTSGTDTPTASDTTVSLAARCTVTLDDALGDGTRLEFLDETGAATTSPHTLTPNNGKLINGLGSYSFNRSYGGQVVVKQNGNWIATQ